MENPNESKLCLSNFHACEIMKIGQFHTVINQKIIKKTSTSLHYVYKKMFLYRKLLKTTLSQVTYRVW